MKKDIQAISPNPQHENTCDIDTKQEGIGAKYYEINHMKLKVNQLKIINNERIQYIIEVQNNMRNKQDLYADNFISAGCTKKI